MKSFGFASFFLSFSLPRSWSCPRTWVNGAMSSYVLSLSLSSPRARRFKFGPGIRGARWRGLISLHRTYLNFGRSFEKWEGEGECCCGKSPEDCDRFGSLGQLYGFARAARFHPPRLRPPARPREGADASAESSPLWTHFAPSLGTHPLRATRSLQPFFPAARL